MFKKTKNKFPFYFLRPVDFYIMLLNVIHVQNTIEHMKEEIKQPILKNRLLKRQIKRTFGHLENVPQNVWSFLEAVDKSYSHFGEDRELLERAMEISSEELYEANAKLRAEATEQKQIFSKLRQSLSNLLSLDLGLEKQINVFNRQTSSGVNRVIGS